MKNYLLVIAVLSCSKGGFSSKSRMEDCWRQNITPWAEKVDPACPLPEYPRHKWLEVMEES